MVSSVRKEAFREYDDSWRSVLASAKSLASDGSNLARVLNGLQKPASPNPNARLLDKFGYRLCGRRLRGISEHYFEAPLCEMLLLHELVRSIEPDTANIVELGSGYSRNLFNIWIMGGPASGVYVGAEFTPGGRECASYLASLESRISHISVPFDYHKPNLTGFDGRKKTFVFTCYSIEQVPEIDVSVFDALLAIPGLYRVVHFEPVGWQRQSNRPFFFTKEAAVLRAARESALGLNYNRNLLQVVDILAADKKIRVENIRYDFIAHRPNLPGTIISWRPS